jgi:hypothetical protein
MTFNELDGLVRLIKLWRDQGCTVNSTQEEAELVNFVRTALPIVRPSFKLTDAEEGEIIFTIDTIIGAGGFNDDPN